MRTDTKGRAQLAGACVLLLCAACGADSRQDAVEANELLRFVPADSPYVVATGGPLDDDFLDAIEPHVDEILDAYRELLSAAAGEAASADEAATDPDAIDALLAELAPMFSTQGLHDAGFERNAPMVLYGNGLLPVIRIAIADTDAFEKKLAGLENAAGEALPTATIGKYSYRYVEDEEARVIVGLFDNSAVLTVMPAGLDEARLRLLLGLELPAKNIGDAGTLSEIVAAHGFSNHYVGYIDSLRLVDAFIAEPTGLNAALAESMEFDASSLSDVCKAEIREVAAIAPRAVFGYDEISTDRIAGRLVVQLRDDIAASLRGITSPVPGLGKDPGGIFSVGASVDLAALRDFYAARLDAMEKDPFECEYFADLQGSVDQGRELLAKPLPPMIYGIHGFNAVVNKMDVEAVASGEQPDPATLEAAVVVAMKDTAALVAMGMMFSPELAAMNLQPDGKPVAMALPQLDAMSIDAYAAMLTDALSVAVGPSAESRVTAALSAESATPPPLFSVFMDAGTYYSLLAERADLPAAEDEEPMSPEAQQAVRRMFAVLGAIYDRMSTSVKFTESGAEMSSATTLKDL